MEMTLRDTIKELTRTHLEVNNGLLFGQCISAVGWVNGTVPDCKNLVELPMCDVAGVGIAVGAAIAGRKPILVVRFQDFMTLGMSQIVNYAAKSKQFFGNGCSMLIRLLADESVGLGPVHSGKLHSLFLQFPGLKVSAPITSGEYVGIWTSFILDDCPYIVCEHRASFDSVGEYRDMIEENSDITLYGVSIARKNMYLAQQDLYKAGIKCNLANITLLKPLRIPESNTKFGLVIDTGFENGGASQHIAYKIMEETDMKVFALGLKDSSVGVTTETANQTPSVDQIVNKVKKILGV
jgi:acetoin:2,6-dichlorophenolindophenol oxidoreductase subunit beta